MIDGEEYTPGRLDEENMDKVFSQPPESQEQSNAEDNGSEDNKSSIPEKFKGKTAEEIAKSYQNLESYSGRLTGEINQIKETLATAIGIDKKEVNPKNISEMISKIKSEKEQTINKAGTKEEEKDAVDDYENFLDDPNAYIKKKFSEMSPELISALKDQLSEQYENLQEKEKTKVEADKLSLSFVQEKLAEGYDVNPKDLATIVSENPNIVPNTGNYHEDMRKGLDIAFQMSLAKRYKERGITSQVIASKKKDIKQNRRDKLLDI
ncbi:MAG: hypothetical protein J7M12_02545 [Candidatus Hydrogenedentes bacterium]|nr:hypothetical protein [Candidatus Hydrogenedentota bacterium]